MTTRTTSTTWGGEAPVEEWARYGSVEWIRETVQRQQGDPAAGAVAGAIIGGLLGSSSGGRVHYDRYGRAHRHGSGAGAVGGAVVGAVIGAAASQGGSETRTYEVFVRYEDGGGESYVYRGAPPFAVGEPVVLTPRGLSRQ
jgi:outer membrane lipoprotein SlyB